jgi:hypothetical protein
LTTAPAAGGDLEANANLVEMAIYGLASIYEKFPPKPKPGEQPIQVPPTSPATPPAPDAPAAPADPGAPKDQPKDAPKDAPPAPTPPM